MQVPKVGGDKLAVIQKLQLVGFYRTSVLFFDSLFGRHLNKPDI